MNVMNPGGFQTLLLIALALNLSAHAAEDALAPLEKALLGRAYTGQAPLNIRLSQLERLMGKPAPPHVSPSYRMNQLYALHEVRVSQQANQTAVRAYNQGVAHAEAGRYTEAVVSYQLALKYNPGFIQAYNNLGNLFEHLQRLPDAIQVYQKALQQAPRDATLHRNLGVVYERSGQIAEALNHYRQYIKLASSPDPAIANIVEQYETQRQQGNAAPDYVEVARTGTEGQTLVWPRNTMPIPVYIAVAADQTPFLPAIRESLQAWETAGKGLLRFREVGLPAQGQIHITLQEGPLTHPYLSVGHASFDLAEEAPNSPHRKLSVSITVNTGERDAPIPLEQRLVQVRRLALHEIGHAIGIWGHSTSPDDIMFSRPIASQLSARDVRTIRRLYGETTPEAAAGTGF